MTLGKRQITLSDIFSFINVLKIAIPIIAAGIIIWLNSRYASQDQLATEHQRIEFITERVSALEQKSKQDEKLNSDIVSSLKSMERRLSYLVTEDGRVLYDNKIINMEKDISLMQKDIQYLRESEAKKNSR